MPDGGNTVLSHQIAEVSLSRLLEHIADELQDLVGVTRKLENALLDTTKTADPVYIEAMQSLDFLQQTLGDLSACQTVIGAKVGHDLLERCVGSDDLTGLKLDSLKRRLLDVTPASSAESAFNDDEIDWF
ncbi:hypothetical protein [Pseudaestuariivita rosea]|uniref:hypothetical protein n=1 Tax=Pseudaestuariivita rosea TaxID=2763263 RepID=UPI001ABB65BC|nr:hypothetical protein [Pseudaestuariivita rosea]